MERRNSGNRARFEQAALIAHLQVLPLRTLERLAEVRGPKHLGRLGSEQTGAGDRRAEPAGFNRLQRVAHRASEDRSHAAAPGRRLDDRLKIDRAQAGTGAVVNGHPVRRFRGRGRKRSGYGILTAPASVHRRDLYSGRPYDFLRQHLVRLAGAPHRSRNDDPVDGGNCGKPFDRPGQHRPIE